MTEFQFNDAALANLKDKVAIVTGGSSGIGRGTVEYFAKHSAKVVSADINPPPDSLPEGVAFQKCNVAVWSDVVKLFEVAHKLHGKIDIVCPNAGVNDRSNLLSDDLEEPQWIVMEVNLKGVMMCVKAAAYYFRRNTPMGGVVVLTGSITSYVPAHEGAYVYSATKYGVLGMLRNMRRYFPKFHSRINMVAPYLTDTGMAREKKADPSREYRKNQPVNQPIAIAKAIAALAADETKHGKSVICVGEHYYETEEVHAKQLPEMASKEVVDQWNTVLKVNPFGHMQANDI